MTKEIIYDVSNINWLQERFKIAEKWNPYNYEDFNFISFDNKGVTLETFTTICESLKTSNVLELSRIMAKVSTEHKEILVKRNPDLLSTFKPITDTMCKYAVETEPSSIRFFTEKHFTPELCLQIVQKDATLFSEIPKSKQTEECCYIAVQEYPKNITHIKNPSEELQILAVEQSPSLIEWLENPTEKVIITALSQYNPNKRDWQGNPTGRGYLLEYIPEELRTEAVCLAAVKTSPEAFKHVINQTEAICVEALKHLDVRKQINKLTPKMWGAILSSDYLRFFDPEKIPEKYITKDNYKKIIEKGPSDFLTFLPKKYKTPELFKEILEKTPSSIAYLTEEEQTEELCDLVVSKNPYSLTHIINPSLKIIKKALSIDGSSIRFVKTLTLELCEIAIETFPRAIGYIKNQTEELGWKVIKRNYTLLTILNNSTEEMCLYVINEHHKVMKDTSVSRSILAYIPKEFHNEKIFTEIIKSNGLQLEYIQDPTEELCLLAVSNDSNAVPFVPRKYRTEKLAQLLLIQPIKDKEIFRYFAGDIFRKLLKGYL